MHTHIYVHIYKYIYIFMHILCMHIQVHMGFPGVLDGKESTCNAGDQGSIPGLRRPPGEENSNPLQYHCLENSMGRGTLLATVHGVTKSHT